MIFISVNTPTKKTGFGAGYASDLKWVESSARQVAKYARGHTIVVEKSTVTVRTAELIQEILNELPRFDISTSKNVSICLIFLSKKPHSLINLSLSTGSSLIC